MIVMYAVFLAMVCWTELLLLRLGVELPHDVQIPRGVLLLLGAGLFGAYRVLAFHPALNSEYHDWLRLTPWTPDRRLPLGPVRLTVPDLLVMAVFAALGYENHFATASHCVLAYVGTYLVIMSLLIALTSELRWYAYPIWFGLGLVVRLFGYGMAPILALSGTYILAYVGLQKTLEALPRASRFRDVLKSELMARTCDQRGPGGRLLRSLGYPYDTLLRCPTRPIVSVAEAAVLSALAAWFAHVGLALSDPSEQQMHADLVTVAVPISVAAVRFCIYCLTGLPPISLWGRLRTGTLLIPDYDYVLGAPLLAVAAGLFVGRGLLAAGVSTEMTGPATVFVTLLVALGMGPSLGDWKLLGRHRAIIPCAVNTLAKL